MQLELLVQSQVESLGQTPCSNTGLVSPLNTPLPFSVDTPVLSVDNLSLMWYKRDDFDILPMVRDLLLVDFDFTTSHSIKIGVVWENCYRGSMGCLYMFRQTDKGVRCRLSISGKACSSVPLDLLLRFLEVVGHANADLVCSRIDVCLDDYGKRLTFDNLCAALDAGNMSGFRKGDSVKNHDRSGGWTVYLGSRQSEHFVRIYNKSAESKKRIDAVRWESEFKGGKADSIFRKLVSCKTVVASLANLEMLIFGDFDFIHKVDRNIERCDRLDWWDEFLLWVGFGRCKILTNKPVTSIESRVLWIKKQVEKSLALLSCALGLDDFQSFVDERVASGLRRLTRFDNLMLLEYLNSRLSDGLTENLLQV